MKKFLVLAVVLGLVAGSLGAPAMAKKKKKGAKVERVAEATYDNPAIGIGGVVSSGSAGGSAEFPLMPGETFFSLDVTDASGTAVYASLSQDTDPSTPSWEIFAGVCGKTTEPIEVAPDLPVRVTITAGPGRQVPTCAGVASSGTIKVTLSNLP